MTAADRAEVVEQAWPYDGPHSAESVTSAAAAAAALVRYLNNATQPTLAGHTLPAASTVDQVLGRVTALVYGLQQLLDQLAVAVERQVDNPTLYDDRHDRPGSQTAGELAATLRDVADNAVPDLARWLDSARQLSSRLGGWFDQQT